MTEEQAPRTRAEVVLRAAETGVELQRLQDRAAESPSLQGVSTEVHERREAVRALAKRSEAQAESALYIEQIDDLEYVWARQAQILTPHLTLIDAEAERFQAIHARLDDLGDLWQRTEAAFPAEGEDDQVAAAITGVLAQLSTLRTAVNAAEMEVLRVKSDIAQVLASIERVVDRVRGASPNIVTALRHPDVTPVWARVGQRPIEIGVSPRARLQLLGEFVSLAGLRLAAHLLAIAGLALVVRRLAARAAAGEGPPPVAPPLQHPIALAVLVGLGASPLLYAALPSPALHLMGAAAAIALLRLLPSLCTATGQRVGVLLVGTYVVDLVRYVGMGVAAIEVWLFVAEVAFAGWVAYVAGRARAAEGSRLRSRPLRAAALAVAAAMAATVVADVAGYRALAAIVGLGLLRSVWTAAVLLVGTRALISVAEVARRQTRLVSISGDADTGEALIGEAGRFVRIAAVGAWVLTSMQALTIRNAAFDWLEIVATAPRRLGFLEFTLLDVGRIGLGITVTVIVARLIRFVLRDEILPRFGVGPGGRHALATTIFYGALLIGVLVTLGAAGLKANQFAFLAGALGLGVGFGLQNIVNNFVSGIILLFGRPIEVGDFIETSALEGTVRRIGFRSSTVHTLEGAEVIVPNAELISNDVTNWTHSDRRRRVDIPVGVAYGSPIREISQLLQRAASKQPGVLQSPAATVLFSGFGDSSLDFEVRIWTLNEDWVIVRSAVATAIGEALEAEGVEIPFPQRDLHLRSADPAIASTLAGPTERQ